MTGRRVVDGEQVLAASLQRPTPADLARAEGAALPDIVAENLTVLFCGINPSLYSAAVGHHFARPGNRFWKAIHLAGFTAIEIHPRQDHTLPSLGLGLTNLVNRATAKAASLEAGELEDGADQLTQKVLTLAPKALAIAGLTAFRTGFRRPRAIEGLQDFRMGSTIVWALPNPSGLNAHHTAATLGISYAKLRCHLMGHSVGGRI